MSLLVSFFEEHAPWSVDRARALAALVKRQPAMVADLVEHLWSDNVEIQARAADAAEKLAVAAPALLARYTGDLIALFEQARKPKIRWHLALLIPRLPLSREERDYMAQLLIGSLDETSSVVRTCALEGLTILALADYSLEPAVMALLRKSVKTGTKAMKCRAPHLMRRLQKGYRLTEK